MRKAMDSGGAMEADAWPIVHQLDTRSNNVS